MITIAFPGLSMPKDTLFNPYDTQNDADQADDRG